MQSHFQTRLDRKGVNTHTGNGTITYFNAADMPFATGSIVRDLYKMNVKMIKADGTEVNADLIASAITPQLIASMVLSVTSLFGSDSEDEGTKRLGFSTV